MSSAEVLHGEALEALRGIEDDSVDAVVTDPPYGLASTSASKVVEAMSRWAAGERDFVPAGRGFMGRGWDSFVPPPAVWDECLRVLRPGGHLLAFSGSRTYDLMGLSIRFAGFEIRDGLSWIYGTGMPHGQKIARSMSAEDAEEWEGWNTALKPAQEPIVLARKPLGEKTVVGNTLAHGTGGLNVAAACVPYASDSDRTESEEKNRHADFGSTPGTNSIYGDYTSVPKRNYSASSGRHPANVVLSHGPECVALGLVDVRTDTHFPARRGRGGIGITGHSGQEGLVESSPATETVESWDCGPGCPVAAVDEQGPQIEGAGGPSRFFNTFVDPETPARYVKKAPSSERPSYIDDHGEKVAHVSVKPLDLMRWLVRLSCRTGGLVLDPFAGSGTTLEACVLEGINVVSIEREAEYLPLIRQRLERHSLSEEGRISG